MNNTYLIEATIPEYTGEVFIDKQLVSATIPETIQDVEIDLDEFDIDLLIIYVQNNTKSTLVDEDRLREVEEMEETFEQIIEVFEKYSIDGIRKQEFIEKFISLIENN